MCLSYWQSPTSKLSSYANYVTRGYAILRADNKKTKTKRGQRPDSMIRKSSRTYKQNHPATRACEGATRKIPALRRSLWDLWCQFCWQVSGGASLRLKQRAPNPPEATNPEGREYRNSTCKCRTCQGRAAARCQATQRTRQFLRTLIT